MRGRNKVTHGPHWQREMQRCVKPAGKWVVDNFISQPQPGGPWGRRTDCDKGAFSSTVARDLTRWPRE